MNKIVCTLVNVNTNLFNDLHFICSAFKVIAAINAVSKCIVFYASACNMAANLFQNFIWRIIACPALKMLTYRRFYGGSWEIHTFCVKIVLLKIYC